LSEEEGSTDSESERLTLDYISARHLAADYRIMWHLGWRVEGVIAPEEERPLGLPVWLLRRFSRRFRYQVTYVRRPS
jgi:hypothetical protein